MSINIFSALADPIRRRILEMLADKYAIMGMNQSLDKLAAIIGPMYRQ
jgi:DNA-binding transcriptional ArsR family regulator